MKQDSGLLEMKRQNRRRIKALIYRKAPITRGEVARQLGLTLPTVTTSVADMLAEGMLQEMPVDHWQAGPQGGRKPLALDFDPDAACALGMELHPGGITALATDLRGRTLARVRADQAPAAYSAMLDAAVCCLKELMDRLPGRRVLGAGVGLPGFIETARGSIRFSYHPDWQGRQLAADLSGRLGLEVIIDNNARMRITSEEMFARPARPDAFAYFFISRGIACPVLAAGDVWSGCTAGAGEIGHTIVQPGGPVCPRCGHHGCLDAVASENAILRQCAQAIQEGRAPRLAALAGNGPLEMAQVLQAQQQGDQDVEQILAQAIRYLGIALANTANLLSPPLVLVDGYLMQHRPNRELLRHTVARYLYGLNSDEVRLEFLPFDPDRGARGAAGRIVKQLWLGA